MHLLTLEGVLDIEGLPAAQNCRLTHWLRSSGLGRASTQNITVLPLSFCPHSFLELHYVCTKHIIPQVKLELVLKFCTIPHSIPQYNGQNERKRVA